MTDDYIREVIYMFSELVSPQVFKFFIFFYLLLWKLIILTFLTNNGQRIVMY